MPNIYKPFPKVALALVLTVVSIPNSKLIKNGVSSANHLKPFSDQNCIDEWVDGIHTTIHFTQDSYETIFSKHLEELDCFNEFTKVLQLLPSLLQDLHDTWWCVLQCLNLNWFLLMCIQSQRQGWFFREIQAACAIAGCICCSDGGVQSGGYYCDTDEASQEV